MRTENIQIKEDKKDIVVQDDMHHAFLKTFENPIKPIVITDTNLMRNVVQNPTGSNSNVHKESNHMQQSMKDLTHAKSNVINKAQKNKKVVQTSQFFSKTKKILQYLSNLSIFDNEILQKGMKIDLSSNNSKFFELYIGAELHLACAYTYILDERTFAKKDSPHLHFIRCETIKKASQESMRVCVPTKNAFDYRVRSGGVDTRLFYEHPLRICPQCIAELCEILSVKHKRTIHANQIREEEILGLLFKNKLKNIVQ